MKGDAGWSLVELLVAIAVAGIVAAAVTGLLLAGFRSFREQSARAGLNSAIQQSAALVHAEFRGLDSQDSLHADIVATSQASITYKPMRTLRFLCRTPDTSTAVVTTWPTYFGVRDLRPDLDSLLLLVMTMDREYWLGADVVDVGSGKCPTGTAGVSIHLNGISAASLAALLPGAPVLAGEVSEIKSYQDGAGRWWLGMRRFQKASGRWPAIQPVLGPLERDGLQLRYFGQNGGLVTNHTDVARIQVRITYEAADAFARQGDRESVFDVALRGRSSGG